MFIFFDIDDTLVDHRAAIGRAKQLLYERLDLPVSREAFLASWHESHQQLYPRFLKGEMPYPAVARARVRAAIDADLSDVEADRIFDEYLSDYEAGWSLLPDALPCLDSVAGRRLGIISNGRSGEQRRKLARTGIANRFEHVVISEDCGRAKPSAEMFHLACSAVRVPVEDAVHVGDNYELDACGARNAGLRGIWLDRAGRASRDHRGPLIGSLHELAGVL